VRVDGYSSHQAAALAQISYRQLDCWARRRLVEPSLAAATGQGSRRRYSFADVVALRTVAELQRAGVSLQALRQVVEELRRLDAGVSLATVRLVVDGNDVLLLNDQAEVLSMLARPGQAVLRAVVDVGQVVRQLAEALPERVLEAAAS
jgi:DNA-binding transcriptional MerR regulator